MKYLILFSSIIVMLSCSKAIDTDCIPSNLSKSIIAFYPFMNGSLNDFSGNKRHLTNSTGVTFGSDRLNNSNCAARFKASLNQFLTTNGAFTDNVQNKALTISLWSYPEYAEKSDYELLLSRSKSSKVLCPDKYGEWSLGLYDCRRPVGSINKSAIWAELDSKYLNPGVGFNCKDEHNDNSDKWKHIVFTFDGNIRKIYIDGILHNTKQGLGTCGTESRNIGDIFIGNLYTGLIDDIILFDKALVQSEVAQLYQVTPCCK